MRNDITPYLICELANSHGGDPEIIRELIDACASVPARPLGVKFQIFKPERIALRDFPWYNVYETLYQEADAWQDILAHAASRGLDTWIDIFDTYGIEVLAENIASVSGIKLQSSVIENEEVLAALGALDLSRQTLMLNVSGHELSAIETAIARVESLGPRGIVLQVGFQHYPTAIEDTGLRKLPVLRTAFPAYDLCVADHASGEDPFSTRIPLLAVVLGCRYVEKHICLDRGSAKYDGHSALEPHEMMQLARELPLAALAMGNAFIGPREHEYLAKSVQVPVARAELPAGSLVASTDVLFRRTSRVGLNFGQVRALQRQRYVLGEAIDRLAPIGAASLRPAKVAVIVAARMKSSRLKGKALLPIAGKPSVERCLENCLSIPNAELVVLATSNLEDDDVLAEHTLDGRVSVWRGDPDDVIARYLGACEYHQIDVIIRVTADCPAVSPEIASLLLDEHFASGADFTAPASFAVGSNSEVYNTRALRTVVDLIGKAEHSEYMTWYMKNNPDIFKLCFLNLPSELVRPYRMTLDYPEDLAMFEALYSRLEVSSYAALPDVFRVLDAHPEIVAMNGHLDVQYRSDPQLIEKLDRATRIQRKDG